jgi:hypothetical protein
VVINLGEGGRLDVVVLALELVDAHQHLLVVDRGDPAEARIQLLLLLEPVQVRIERLLFLQESPENLQKRGAILVLVHWVRHQLLHLS